MESFFYLLIPIESLRNGDLLIGFLFKFVIVVVKNELPDLEGFDDVNILFVSYPVKEAALLSALVVGNFSLSFNRLTITSMFCSSLSLSSNNSSYLLLSCFSS